MVWGIGGCCLQTKGVFNCHQKKSTVSFAPSLFCIVYTTNCNKTAKNGSTKYCSTLITYNSYRIKWEVTVHDIYHQC